MKFQLSLSLGPSGHIVFEGEEFKDIAEWWEAAGGKVEWLTTRLHDLVTAAEEGPAAATVILGLGGQVIERKDPTTSAGHSAPGTHRESQATPYATTAGAAGKNGRKTSEVPLPDEPDDDGGWGAGNVQDDADPWDEPERPTRPTPPRHGSSAGGNRAPRDRDKGVLKDNFGRLWTLDLPDAPLCECGEPAGKMVGTSQSSGKRYTVWRCAKDAPGGNYRDKCEFSEFPER